jgi:purine-binding chemotaxis protein CheW
MENIDYEDELDLSLNQDGEQYLFFSCNNDIYAIDALRVLEIIEYQSFTKVPMMQKFVKGITNIRGELIAVVDLKELFGFGETKKDKKTSMIIVNVKNEENEIKIATIIDEVFEAKYLNEEDIKNAPEFGLKIDSKFIKKMCKYLGNYIPILDIDILLNVKRLSKIEIPK